jgi:hypothetical protein
MEMAFLEPGVLAIGAEDIEKIELTYSFMGTGYARLNLVFPDGKADTEESKLALERRDWLFEVFRQTLVEQASKGSLELTYDPEEHALTYREEVESA